MATPELIYCADGNRRYAEIAIASGFTYGAQLPKTVYYRPEFVDQDWKKTKCKRHEVNFDPSCQDCAARRSVAVDRYTVSIESIANEYGTPPRMATVLDLEWPGLLPEVLDWASAVAPLVSDAVLVIPKYSGAIASLPREINGREIRLAYSVPTSYGGTQVPVWEFLGWPVHLLGGSPHAQMRIAGVAGLNVVSVDGNMMQKMASRRCQYWINGTARYANNRWWPTLRESNDGVLWKNGARDANYEAFRRSCENIIAAWEFVFDPLQEMAK